ncbi:hypothetical protein FB451DRAFT_1049700, partial [Mycena latifolia]
SWIWGHELLAFQHAATQMYSIWKCSFGGLCKIKAGLFHPDIIVATDHAAVAHIFANSDLYVKSPAFRPPIKNTLGKGLVCAKRDDWHRQRKMLSPAFSCIVYLDRELQTSMDFSLDSVKGMTSVIYECAERLETRLTTVHPRFIDLYYSPCIRLTLAAVLRFILDSYPDLPMSDSNHNLQHWDSA